MSDTLYKIIGVFVFWTVIISIGVSLTCFLCSIIWAVVLNLNSKKGDLIRYYLHTDSYTSEHLRELYYTRHSNKLHKLLIMYRLRNIKNSK